VLLGSRGAALTIDKRNIDEITRLTLDNFIVDSLGLYALGNGFASYVSNDSIHVRYNLWDIYWFKEVSLDLPLARPSVCPLCMLEYVLRYG
jgi:hypothetical protein